MIDLTFVATILTRPVSLSLPSPLPVACACNGGSGTRSSPAEFILSFVASFVSISENFGLFRFGLVMVWLQLH